NGPPSSSSTLWVAASINESGKGRHSPEHLSECSRDAHHDDLLCECVSKGHRIPNDDGRISKHKEGLNKPHCCYVVPHLSEQLCPLLLAVLHLLGIHRRHLRTLAKMVRITIDSNKEKIRKTFLNFCSLRIVACPTAGKFFKKNTRRHCELKKKKTGG